MGGPCPATPPSTDRTGEVLIALGKISRQPLSLQLNVGPWSSSLLDRRKPGSGRLSGAFWASRPGRDGFRWMGGSTEGCTQSPKPPPDTRRGELWWVAWPFPRQPMVGDEASSESELGVGGDHEPGPTVGLFGHA